MRKTKLLTTLLCAGFVIPFLVSANNSAQRVQVIKFVQQAKQYVLKHGRIAAVSVFNNPKGKFQHNTFYIFSVVCNDGKNNGFVLSDLATPQYTFKNRLHTNLIHRFVEEATVKGTWFSYKWKNPLTQKAAAKHAYVIRIPAQKICLGSGYYDVK